MNSTKRILELIAAIFSIVLGGILVLGSLEIFLEYSSVLPGVLLTLVLLFLAAVASIILGSFLCTKPIKNGVVVKRTGLLLAVVIINGVIALLELIGGSVIFFLLFAVPTTLGIVSLCLKDNQNNTNNAPVSNNINDQINL